MMRTNGRTVSLVLALCVGVAGLASSALATDAVQAGRLTMDPPTLSCLGFAWEISGDDNRNATARVEYRKAGDADWRQALALLRIGGQHVGRTSDWLDHQVPHMLAGSIMDLEEATEYEVRITVEDPDGVEGEASKVRRVRTRGEPVNPEGGRVFHVYPPEHPIRWPQNEFKNLYNAYYGGVGNLGDFNMVWPRKVQPGDTILVHAGTYRADLQHYTDRMGLVSDGTYWLTAKGTAEQPIVIKAAGDGEVIFDGAGADVLFNVMAADYHTFEGITFRNAGTAIFAGMQDVGGAVGLTVRNCRFENVRDGVFTLYAGSRDFHIADNVFVGRNVRDRMTPWGGPEEGYLKSNTAITVQGSGHVIRRNAIAYFWQAVHMGTAFPGWDSGAAIDIYENDLHVLVDDGVETDGGVRNIRVLRNRIANTGSALSAQPIYGGPAYFIRNVAYNFRMGMKFHEAHPSGLIACHNTFVGDGLLSRGLYTNAHFRNNLYLSPSNHTGVAGFPEGGNGVTADFNGYDGRTRFLVSVLDGFAPVMDKSRDPWWPLKRYPPRETDTVFDSFEAFREATGHEAHGRLVDGRVFADLQPYERPGPGEPRPVVFMEDIDLRLHPHGPAMDAGTVLPNVNDGFTGQAPDLGAYEVGHPRVHYGPPGWKGWRAFEQAQAERRADE